MASPGADGERHTGRCLCGAVVYELRGPLRDVLFCHCVECRRWGGHAAAMTAVPDERLVLFETRGLRWIDSPDSGRARAPRVLRRVRLEPVLGLA